MPQAPASDIFSGYPYNIPVDFAFKVVFQDNQNIMQDNNECMFQEISGINASFEVETVTEGGVNNYQHRLPKAVKYENLVLKRGLYRGSSLITWVNNALINFQIKPIPVEVSLLDNTSKKIVTWTFNSAYPVALKMGNLKSTENGLVIETLELAYTFFTRTDN